MIQIIYWNGTGHWRRFLHHLDIVHGVHSQSLRLQALQALKGLIDSVHSVNAQTSPHSKQQLTSTISKV